MEELLIDEGEVDSKVMVGQGNDQMGKEEDKSEVTKEANEAKKAKYYHATLIWIAHRLTAEWGALRVM